MTPFLCVYLFNCVVISDMLNFAFLSLKIQTRIVTPRYYMKYILINIACGKNFHMYSTMHALESFLIYLQVQSVTTVSLFCFVCIYIYIYIYIVGPPFAW
jgi:hypothetical protein